jgi:hypothetical protein
MLYIDGITKTPLCTMLNFTLDETQALKQTNIQEGAQ